MPALSSSLSEILIKNHPQQPSQESWLNKVPPITLAFWVIKIMSTGGLGLGAKWTSIIFLTLIVILVAIAQAKQRNNAIMQP